MQAEEAERLRATADAEAQARQSAEAVVQDLGASERAKLKAARDREAELARQEAELRKAAGKNRHRRRTSPSDERSLKNNKIKGLPSSSDRVRRISVRNARPRCRRIGVWRGSLAGPGTEE
jgi:hypothetical protein